MPLSREDYLEPVCLLNMKPSVTAVPIRRILEKLDEALSRNQYDEAERLLNYWSAEAESGGDESGLLTILNEKIGLYRKLNRRAEAMDAVQGALTLAEKIGLAGVSLATTLINAATARAAFDLPEEALPLYERARESYESLLSDEDERLGALYNNMALTLLRLGRLGEAEELFYHAIHIMEQQTQGEIEVAITCCNLADLCASREGEDSPKVGEWLHRAQNSLDTPELERNGSYAYACEKCAPVFAHYGYPLTEKVLLRRAKEIYERA